MITNYRNSRFATVQIEGAKYGGRKALRPYNCLVLHQIDN
jgi:hypothetical protein